MRVETVACPKVAVTNPRFLLGTASKPGKRFIASGKFDP